MKTFNELNLSQPLMQAISALGYETPSAIQAQALPILLGAPTDFIGQAATGTGKTAAFGIPLLEQIDAAKKVVQGLILCPTRELAMQVTGQINLLGKFKNIKALAIYGGASYGDQIHGLKSGAQIVVGTPGRLIDHLERGTLKLDEAKTIILDEADEMISMGFKEDLEMILQASPRETSQIWLFSATLSKEVRRVADTYLRRAQQVQVNRTEMLSTTVEQLYYPSRESDKPEILCKLIEAADNFYGIIFCQTKSLVMDLSQYLSSRGYKVDCLHGDKTQNDRERTMQAFRDHRVNMLVCTDVASRGLDVKDITHVINYSIPRELDVYVHRIGRTARSGKSGIAMSLVTPSHRGLIGRIEQMTKSRMKEGKIPTRKDIGAKKVTKMLSQFQEQQFFARAIEHLGEEWKAAIANMPSEEIVGRFLTLLSPEVFENQERTKPLLDTRTAPGQSQVRSDGRRDDGRRDSRGGGDRRDDRRRDSRGRDESRGGGGYPRRDSRSDDSRGGGGGYPRRERATDEGPRRDSTRGEGDRAVVATEPRAERREYGGRSDSPRAERRDSPRAERSHSRPTFRRGNERDRVNHHREDARSNRPVDERAAQQPII
ncbi:MAG: DEAD/DEAH box helicase [Bdellovibrionales bacterium]